MNSKITRKFWFCCIGPQVGWAFLCHHRGTRRSTSRCERPNCRTSWRRLSCSKHNRLQEGRRALKMYQRFLFWRTRGFGLWNEYQSLVIHYNLKLFYETILFELVHHQKVITYRATRSTRLWSQAFDRLACLTFVISTGTNASIRALRSSPNSWWDLTSQVGSGAINKRQKQPTSKVVTWYTLVVGDGKFDNVWARISGIGRTTVKVAGMFTITSLLRILCEIARFTAFADPRHVLWQTRFHVKAEISFKL